MSDLAIERSDRERQERRAAIEAELFPHLDPFKTGLSLLWIVKQEELYLLTHETFEDYCREVLGIRWKFGREEKRQLIAAKLVEDPRISDRQIAAVVGVSHVTVGTARQELIAKGEVVNLTTTVGVDGVTQPRQRQPVKVEAHIVDDRPLPKVAFVKTRSSAVLLTGDIEHVADQICRFYSGGEVAMLVARLKARIGLS